MGAEAYGNSNVSIPQAVSTVATDDLLVPGMQVRDEFQYRKR